VNGGALPVEVFFNGAFWLYPLALVPAAVVTILKGDLTLFFTGFLTLGLTWVIGALSLARPDSPWAEQFYGERKLARANDPERHPRTERDTALLVGGTLALLLAVGLLASRPAPLIGVHGTALQYSVGGGNLGSSMPPCRHAGDGSWSCQKYDSGFSSYVPYRVEVGKLGCWNAVRGADTGEGSEKRLSGCITIWDEIRLMNAIF
jgi:hypothetical protein